jgi:hypothetical protein
MLALATEPKTYQQLKTTLQTSDNVLAFNLRKLQRQGYIKKEPKKRGVYSISPHGDAWLKNRLEIMELYRIPNGIKVPLVDQILDVPIDVYIAASDINIKTALFKLADTLNTLIPTLVQAFCDEAARQKGFQDTLNSSPSIAELAATRKKYDLELSITIHYDGHAVLGDVDWQALSKKAEALNSRVEAGLGILKQNLQNEDFCFKLKQSFIEKFGEKHGEEMFAALLQTIGK